MKNCIIYFLGLYSLLAISSCKKTHTNTTDPNNIAGLPPATQIGANTFGCLVNGVPWLPDGHGGSIPNLSIDYDSGFNNGIFGITAYRKTATENTYIALGINDSIRLISAPYKFSIGYNLRGGAYYNDVVYCERMTNTVTHYSKGSITINKLDRVNQIISGVFECVLYSSFCGDTIKITNGRFDFKF